MNYEIIITFITATAVLAFSPGPDNIYVLMQSITHGTKFGLATVSGLISGCLLHTSLIAFGVSTILKTNDTLYLIIKLLGALYLLYLAYKVFKSEAKISLSNANVPKKGLWQLFRQGAIMNVLNPKVSLFFLAFFPGFLFSDTLNTVAQFFVLGFVFMATSFIVFSAIAILAGYLSNYIKSNQIVGVILKWLQIIVFVGIAIFILLSKK